VKTIGDIFSANLRRIRKERGDLSQEDFAHSIGLIPVSYQRYENGVIPKGENMGILLDKLKIPEPELYVDRDAYVPREAIAIQVTGGGKILRASGKGV
jgi:transcriptional regulator with XRE-family HTH domain